MIGITLGLNGGGGAVKENYALDFDGSGELLSTVPTLKLTSEYSLQEDFADGNYDGWTVASGAYSVADATPLSGGAKALKCDTAGVISIPCNQAYGRWEFDLYKGNDINYPEIGIISPNTSAPYNNAFYLIRISNLEAINLFRTNNTVTLQGSASAYISNTTWYRFKIIRNTNGQFQTYIKGGTFGNSYILVAVTTGSNPIIDNTHNSSNYFVLDLDANDMIANIQCEYGEGSLDLNGYNRIFHSDNSNFEGGVGDWTGSGNHSIVQSNEHKQVGTYSGKVTSVAAGDGSNCVTLAANKFRPVQAGKKYTIELWVKPVTTGTILTASIAGISKSSAALNNSTFTKFVWNFLATEDEAGQALKLWINQTDSVYIDTVTISQAYDLMALWWFKTTANAGTFWSYSQIGTSGAEGYTSYINNNQCRILSSDGTSITDGTQALNTSISINDGNWKFLELRIIRATDEISISVNRVGSNSNIHRLGRQNAFENIAFYIAAFRDLSNKLSGQMGELQLIKFDDISMSNVTSQKLLEVYNRRTLIKGEFTGGGAQEIAFYDWKGQEADFCNDKSGTANHLTKTNITLTDRVMR